MPIFGPGLGHGNDYWNPTTRQVQMGNNFVSTDPTKNVYAEGIVGSRPNSGVLGASTSASSGRRSNAPAAQAQAQAPATQQSQPAPDPYAGLRNEISSSWDNFINGTNDLANNTLPQQRLAQENIANNQYTQGQETINTQKSASLRDIGSNIRNAFSAGNNFLGSRGAGDSSAAGQYQFALSQEASKQTGKLNEFVNTQLSQLKSQNDQQINSIAAWFADAQSQLKQQVLQGGLNKSKDLQSLSQNILNQALQQKAQVQQEASSRYNALLSWAANNSTTMQGLRQNMSGIPSAIGQAQVDSGGNFSQAPVGYGTGQPTQTQDQKQLFQNPSWFGQ